VTGNRSKTMSTLLHEALERASLKAATTPTSPRTPSRPFSPLSDAGSESEDEIVEVRTPLTSRPASRAGSRSTSPTRRSAVSQRRKEKDLEKLSSLDPLRRLPNEISSRIFVLLSSDIHDLVACQRVCKKWAKSQTLNWCWYILFQRTAFIDSPPITLSNDHKPVWSRKDSKQDWAKKYKNTFRRDDLVYREAADAEFDRARSEGYRTPKEQREDKWSEENTDGDVLDKAAARAYYKSLKNSKVKGKGGKASGTGSRDRTGYADGESDGI